MSVPLILTKEGSFNSKWRLLTEMHNWSKCEESDCSQPQQIHIQCKLYTQGSGKSWKRGQKNCPLNMARNVHPCNLNSKVA